MTLFHSSSIQDLFSGSLFPALSLTGLFLLAILAILYPDRPIFVAPHAPHVNYVKGGWPLVGHLNWVLQISSGKKRLLDEILILQRTPGMGAGGQPMSVAFPAMGGRVTVINNPRYLEWVQKTNFDNYPKGPEFQRAMSDVLGPHGIFVADGAPWFQQRKLAAHIFSKAAFSGHVQDTIKAEIDKLDKLLIDACDGEKKVQFCDLMFRFTLSTFAFLAFNAEVNVMPDNVQGLQKLNEFGRDFDYAQTAIDARFLSILPTWTEWFTSDGYRMRSTVANLHSYCYRIIDSRLARKEAGGQLGATTKAGKDLLELFIDQGITREELLPVLLNFIVAGRDTTAQSLAWFFYEMWKNPEQVAKIRESLVPILGPPGEQRAMEFDDYKELPYLQACFYETIRLWPAVPKNAKYVLKDDVIQPSAPGKDASDEEAVSLPPVQVRKGESVLWSDWAMARMPEVWGQDCEQFKPERFLEKDGDGRERIREYSQWQFHAFNAGPRLCLGKLLATYEGMAVIAAILGRYDVVYDSEELHRNPPDYQDSLTLPCSPYWVSFRKRHDI